MLLWVDICMCACVCACVCVCNMMGVQGEKMRGKVVSMSNCMHPLYLSVRQTLGWAAGGRQV